MSEHQLEYRYQVGDVLRYLQTTYYVMEDPQLGQLSGQTVSRLTQRVVGAEDGIFDLDFKQELVSRGGALGEAVPEHVVNVAGSFRTDRYGALVGRGRPNQPASFPAQPVSPGDTWTVHPGPSDPGMPSLEMRYQFDRVETIEGRLCAMVVNEGGAEHHDEEGLPVRVAVQGYMQFDLEAGRQIKVQTVVQTSWESGKSMQTATELELEA